jgi:hypothetical protein
MNGSTILLLLLLFAVGKARRVRLSFRELKALALKVGFPVDQTDTAAAIAIAESGGDPYADGDATRGLSRGLWQINHKAHPKYDFLSLYDPTYNARAALELYRGRRNTFHDWSTFNDGSYRKYLPAGSSP